ncbi:MAG: hypothetical protein MI975_14275 [Cytophagales bacterium]|nr:hypothetical protein [Cytophagales bacterium]
MEEKNKKSIIEEIKSELEELEGQLKQSGEDFKVYYKKKKKNIAGLIKKYTNEIEESGEEKIHELRESSRELLDLLEADYDLSYTEYENESHKISGAIDKYERKAKEVFNNLSSDVKETKAKLEEELDKNLNRFKTELDIQKAHFKGTKDRAVSEFEEWKEKRLKDIDDFKKDLEQKKERAEEKIDKFSEEISESYSLLKKAFKNLW